MQSAPQVPGDSGQRVGARILRRRREVLGGVLILVRYIVLRSHVRAVASAIAFALVASIALLGSGPASAAAGDDAAVGFSITTTKPTTLSGGRAEWVLNWSCSGVNTPTCDGAVLTVPIPLSVPDNVSPEFCDLTSDSSGNTTSAVVTNSKAIWTVKSSVSAGDSGQLTMSCKTQMSIVPNGNTYIPTGTFTATNAPTVTATGPVVTVTAEAKVSITKTRSGSGGEPALNGPVSYNVVARNASIYTVGFTNVQDMKVTDVLPATAKYVSSNGGGVLSGADAAGLGGTVTWPTSAPGVQELLLVVTVVYPSPPNTGDGDPSTTADNVTNTASVTAKPYLRPNDPALTASTSLTHGFAVPSPNRPGFAVRLSMSNGYVDSNATRGGLASNSYEVAARNYGNTVIDFKLTDNLPCTFTSNWFGGPQTCAPDALAVQIHVFDRARGNSTYPVTVTMLTTARPRTHIVAAGDTAGFPIDPDPKVFLISYTLTGKLAAGEAFEFNFLSSINAALPLVVPAGTVYHNPVSLTAVAPVVAVENCLNFAGGDVTARDDETGTPIPLTFDPAVHCAENFVPASSHPRWGQATYVNDSVQAPGGIVEFIADLHLSEGTPSSPVWTNLLPANMDYLPGSLVMDYGPPNPTILVTANYNGTGRNLIKVTWPGVKLAPGVNVRFYYNGVVKAGTAASNYPNVTNVFDSVYTSDTTANGASPCPLFLIPAVDVNDLNGNGSRTDISCGSTVAYTVVAAAGTALLNTVKGSLDDKFVGSPGFGRTVAGKPATYRLAVINQGNVTLQNIVAYDILPFVGDTGISGSQSTTARGSAYQPTLDAPVAVPAGTRVQYSQSVNPCRGEVFTAGGATNSAPANCVNDWNDTAPALISAVRALRFVISGPVVGGEGATFDLPMNAPTTAAGIAWNTVAISGQRVDNSTSLLPTETGKVGLEAAPVTITKKVLGPALANSNGTQTVRYQIDVTNTGTTSIPYTLDDQAKFGTGITLVSGTVLNTVPGTVVTNTRWDGTTDQNIVTGHTVAGKTTDTYIVTAIVQTSASTTPTAAVCPVDAGGSGGLHNVANLRVGTLNTLVQACTPALLGGLEINKTVDKPTAAHGDTLTYTVTVRNIGVLNASGVTATDLLPAGVTYQPALADGNPAVTGQTLKWSIPVIAAGATVTFTVTATIDPGVSAETLLNQFTITDPVIFPPHSTLNPCATDPTKSCAVTTVLAVTQGQLEISNTADKDTAFHGDLMIYTVTVKNTGGADASNLVATNTLPAAVTWVGGTGGGTLIGREMKWTIDSLPIGATKTYTLVAIIDPSPVSKKIRNSFGVTTPVGFKPTTVNQPCRNDPKQSCSVTVVLAVGQLAIDNTADKDTARHGDRVTYTVNVTNIGDFDASAVRATDTLPIGMTMVSASGGGTMTGRDIRWTIASLPVGETKSFTVIVSINPGSAAATMVNSFTITNPPTFVPPDVGYACSAMSLSSCAVTTVTAAVDGPLTGDLVANGGPPQSGGPAQSGGLPQTGVNLQLQLLAAGLLLSVGFVLVAITRRRRA